MTRCKTAKTDLKLFIFRVLVIVKDSLLESLSNQIGAFDPTQMNDNLIKLEVYYTDLTTTYVGESPAYTVSASAVTVA